MLVTLFIILTQIFLVIKKKQFEKVQAVIPGLNKGEKNLILPLLLGLTLLFFFSLIFLYFILIPAAINLLKLKVYWDILSSTP